MIRQGLVQFLAILTYLEFAHKLTTGLDTETYAMLRNLSAKSKTYIRTDVLHIYFSLGIALVINGNLILIYHCGDLSLIFRVLPIELLHFGTMPLQFSNGLPSKRQASNQKQREASSSWIDTELGIKR